ncbi:MAG: S8 family serine peptidase [Deltaproteobacteria bacterium]|nr:S8 family serine peptidase [Deltaproteobacteria bacterium]
MPHPLWCELEGAAGAEAVLGGYDPASDKWRFSLEGPFWSAVKHAHGLGYRGSGKRVAVIDSLCDLSIPKLAGLVDRVKSYVPQSGAKASMQHGTVVALLIAEVAPECRLDIYSVVRDGVVDPYAVRDAVRDAAGSDADIVNLSLGTPHKFSFTEEVIRMFSEILLGRAAFSKRKLSPENPDCVLCEAASAAAVKGKKVFAAAGNNSGSVFCPGRQDAVYAVGFMSESRENLPAEGGGETERAFSLAPHAPQAMLADFRIREIPGMLGTSFASPLFAGAAALGLSNGELEAYRTSGRAGADASFYQATLAATAPERQDPVLLQRADELFQRAIRHLPHVHNVLQAAMSPGHPYMDPTECPSCGIFAEFIYTNAGLYKLCRGNPKEARILLETARAVAPWSADAAANLAAAWRDLGGIDRAKELFETALSLRPGFPAYTMALEELRK